MKRRFLLLTLAFYAFNGNSQEAINYGKDQCSQCRMLITDKAHASEIQLATGEFQKFGSIECMLNFNKNKKNPEHQGIWVSSYDQPGTLIGAEEAIYLKSEGIPSPMGANLTAFSDRTLANAASTRKEDQIFTWDQLTLKYSEQSLGAVESHSHHDHNRPDAHAPIGVMGDHLHHKDGLMFTLRTMNMSMDGNRNGSEKIDDEEIFNSYMVAPREMKMNMYMLGVMYAPSNSVTLMLMQSYLEKEMDLTARMTMNGMPMLHDFSTKSTGFGNLKLNALIGVYRNAGTSLHLNTGISFPVGTIKNRDETPMNDDAKLPYGMQLGSGTFDLTTGATFKMSFPLFSWGTQILGTVRTGKNSEGYRLGNNYQLNTWAAYRILKDLSVSGRIQGIAVERIEGADSELNPMMVPTANSSNYGGETIRSFAGLNFSFPQTSVLKNFRLGAEIGTPIFENYNGIQMDEKISYNFGLKYGVL